MNRIKISWANKRKTWMGLRTHNNAYDHVWRFSCRDEAKRGRAVADLVEMMATRREYIQAVRSELKSKGFSIRPWTRYIDAVRSELKSKGFN